MANRKFVFYRDWVNVGWFLRMNPMAGTFAWTSLAIDALEEAEDNLTRHTGKALFRLYAHSRGRRLAREEFIKAQEGAARNHRHAKTGSETGWEKYEYPKPNTFEQDFIQWYAKAMAD